MTDAWQAEQLKTENQRLVRENAELRKALSEYWTAYHDEHCVGDWPHPEGEACYYKPPPLVRGCQ